MLNRHEWLVRQRDQGKLVGPSLQKDFLSNVLLEAVFYTMSLQDQKLSFKKSAGFDVFVIG